MSTVQRKQFRRELRPLLSFAASLHRQFFAPSNFLAQKHICKSLKSLENAV